MTDEFEQRVKALALMFECYNDSTVTDGARQTYIEVCQSVSLESVTRGCREFTHGAVERFSRSKIPTTDEFGNHLRKLERERQNRAKRQADEAKQRAEMEVLQNRPKLTPEEKARRAKRVEEVRELKAGWSNAGSFQRVPAL